jgi:hypothetical protein
MEAWEMRGGDVSTLLVAEKVVPITRDWLHYVESIADIVTRKSGQMVLIRGLPIEKVLGCHSEPPRLRASRSAPLNIARLVWQLSGSGKLILHFVHGEVPKVSQEVFKHKRHRSS